MLLVGGVLAALAITRLPGNGGHVPAEGLSAGAPPSDRPARRDPRGAGLAELRRRAGSRGAPGRAGRRAGGAAGRADAAADPAGGDGHHRRRGEPRRDRPDLREPDHRGRAAAGDRRPGARPDPADAAARPGRGGRRLPDLPRPGLVDRAEHQRLHDRADPPARLRPPQGHGLPLDDPAGGRGRARRAGDHPRRPPPARGRRQAPDGADHPRRPGRGGARDRLRRDDRPRHRPGAVLGPEQPSRARRRRGRMVGRRPRGAAAVQGRGVVDLARLVPGRADLPLAAAGYRGRHPGGRPPRLRPDTCRGGRHGRGGGCGDPPAAVRRAAGGDPDRVGRARGDAPDHRGRRRRVRGGRDRGARRQPGGAPRGGPAAAPAPEPAGP